jgi:hypothetical protein
MHQQMPAPPVASQRRLPGRVQGEDADGVDVGRQEIVELLVHCCEPELRRCVLAPLAHPLGEDHVVDHLLSSAPEAARIREGYRLVFLPETNPDGRNAGLGVSHPAGRMPFFEGELTVEHGNRRCRRCGRSGT